MLKAIVMWPLLSGGFGAFAEPDSVDPWFTFTVEQDTCLAHPSMSFTIEKMFDVPQFGDPPVLQVTPALEACSW
ncbi:MAG TPA: hypothetical protein VJ818_09470 [Actinomycetota bacterium]|nr:hypothetical protein [Actinomycetota bacterium]